MARPQKKPDYDAENIMKQLIDEVAEAYLHPRGKFPGKNGRMSLDALGDEFSMSSLKIRKLLVTAGVYDTPLCRRVQEWYESGKSVKEICSLTGLSAASVSGYLPYRRTVYKLKERTLLAERLVRYRKRNQAVSRLEDLLADVSRPAKSENYVSH